MNNKEIIYIDIDKVIPYINNPRHNEEAIEKVASSIKEFGFQNPVIVDKDLVIITGHTRQQAARRLGLKQIPCIIAKELTEAQTKAYRIADNKVGEFAEWDFDKLQIEMQALEAMGFETELTGFSFEEIDKMLEDETEGETQEDDFDMEPPEEPKTKRGDLWILGKHRLLCGDSTKEKEVLTLMNGMKADMVFTDPPYGVSATGGRGETVKKLKMKDIENDDLRKDELTKFLTDFIKAMQYKEGAGVYICYPWATQLEFTKAIKDNGLDIKNCIIWDKKVFGLNGFKGYRPQYEMIYFAAKGDYQWYGDKAQSNIWHISREINREEQGNHPTPKPIELIGKAIINSSKKEDIILDVFGGSGSTLIAAEQLDRICYMMELDERYNDVIVERYKGFRQGAEDIKLIRDGKEYTYTEIFSK